MHSTTKIRSFDIPIHCTRSWKGRWCFFWPHHPIQITRNNLMKSKLEFHWILDMGHSWENNFLATSEKWRKNFGGGRTRRQYFHSKQWSHDHLRIACDIRSFNFPSRHPPKKNLLKQIIKKGLQTSAGQKIITIAFRNSFFLANKVSTCYDCQSTSFLLLLLLS